MCIYKILHWDLQSIATVITSQVQCLDSCIVYLKPCGVYGVMDLLLWGWRKCLMEYNFSDVTALLLPFSAVLADGTCSIFMDWSWMDDTAVRGKPSTVAPNSNNNHLQQKAFYCTYSDKHPEFQVWEEVWFRGDGICM